MYRLRLSLLRLYRLFCEHSLHLLTRALPVMMFSALGTILVFSGVEPLVSLLSFKLHKPEPLNAMVVSQSDEEMLREQIAIAVRRREQESPQRSLRSLQLSVLKASVRPEIVEAGFSCNAERVRELVQRGVAIDTPDDRGETALIGSARRGCTDSILALISLGANPTLRGDNGYSATDWIRFNEFSRDKERMLLASLH